jgi:hypothetical protein
VFDCLLAHGATTQTGFFVDGSAWTPFVDSINGVCGTSCKVGDWTCIGKVSWPYPKSADVSLTFQAAEYVSKGPIEGLEVQVCTSLNPSCDPPLATARTNADGIAVLTFANAPDPEGLGLNGFLQVSSADGGYVPTLVYWGFPLSEPTAGVVWDFSTPSQAQELSSGIVGVPQDPERGQLDVVASDCSWGYAPHAQVKIDMGADGATELYGTTGNRALTSTDQSGLAFILNVPPSTNVRVTETPPGMDRPASVDSVQVRAGWITGVLMYPTQ